MSWHCVGPRRAGRRRSRRSSSAMMPGSAARSAALSAAVGAPVPPRALTMLSSIGCDELRRQHLLRRRKSSPTNPPRRLRVGDCLAFAAMSSGASPCAAGAVRSLKMRGELTIAACSGCASGTLITSMRKSAEFGSLSGVALDAARQLVRRADAGRAGDVDVDVVLVLRIDEHRVRVRAAAGLHVADVLRIRDVGDVEDANAAQAVLADGVLHALRRRSRAGRSMPSPDTKSRFL